MSSVYFCSFIGLFSFVILYLVEKTAHEKVEIVHSETKKQKNKNQPRKSPEDAGKSHDKEDDGMEDDEDTGLGSSIESCEDLRDRLRNKIEMMQGGSYESL